MAKLGGELTTILIHTCSPSGVWTERRVPSGLSSVALYESIGLEYYSALGFPPGTILYQTNERTGVNLLDWDVVEGVRVRYTLHALTPPIVTL